MKYAARSGSSTVARLLRIIISRGSSNSFDFRWDEFNKLFIYSNEDTSSCKSWINDFRFEVSGGIFWIKLILSLIGELIVDKDDDRREV